MSNMGQKLKDLRKAKNLTIREIARRVQVAESTYRDWENGRSIQGEPYLALAKVFGVSLNELFGVEEVPNSSVLQSIEQIQRQADLLRGIMLWKRA